MGILVELAMAPLCLVVYMGECSSPGPDEAAQVSTRSELPRCHWRKRRYVAVISESTEWGVGTRLNGTGSGDRCWMYSMYSLERTNFHSMSWSVCARVHKSKCVQHQRCQNFRWGRCIPLLPQSINQSINQSIDRSIDRSINQSINQSINTETAYTETWPALYK